MNAIYFGPVKGILFSTMLLALLAANEVKAQTSTSTSGASSGSNSNSSSTSGAAAFGGASNATGTGVGVGGAGGSAVGIGGTGVGGAGGQGGQGGLGGASSSTSQGGSSSSTSAGGTSNSNATSGASTSNSAGGNSRSRSNATGGTGQGGTGGNAQSANGLNFNQGNNSPVTNQTPSDVTIRSAPQVYVPSVVTGNVCAIGASGGASFIGTGFAVGATWESEQCERRQTAALLHNAGYKEASRELMCDKREIYEAMRRGGTPCLVRPDWEPKGTVAMPTQIAPAVVTPAPMYMPPPPPKEYPRCNARLGINDNCIS